ncbi:MAG: lipopolysaccharide core heptose(II) kinase RfaY [Candidatus Spyradosoma sp.]
MWEACLATPIREKKGSQEWTAPLRSTKKSAAFASSIRIRKLGMPRELYFSGSLKMHGLGTMRGGGYSVLKKNRIKGDVIKANVDGFDFVLKQMKPGKHAMAKILKSLVCGGNAFRLFRKMNFAFSCGFHRAAEIFLAAERHVAGCVVESFVVMAYVRGVSVTRENAAKYGCEVAEIVDELHRFGIIHGDVCPDNFIVEEKTGILKCIDVSGKFSTPMARGYDLYSVASRFSQPFPERHLGMRLWMLREKARTNLRRLRLKLFRRNERDDA